MATVIAVDTGNVCIKTVKDQFVSGLKEYKTRPSNGESLCFEGRFYSLVNERRSYEEDKTKSIDTFILTLFGVCKYLSRYRDYEEGMDIVLSVGLPPEHMLNAAKRDAWAAYFVSYGRKIECEYNGKKYSFYIKKVDICPQGYALVFSNPEYSKLNKLYVCDIGGYTVDVIKVCKGILDNSLIRSLSLGIITYYNMAQNQVKTDTGINIDEDTINEFLETGTTNRKDVTEALQTSFTEYAKKVINKISELDGIDLRLHNVVFIGGGAKYLESEIKKVSEGVKSVTFIKDPRINAIGYQKMTERKLSRK